MPLSLAWSGHDTQNSLTLLSHGSASPTLSVTTFLFYIELNRQNSILRDPSISISLEVDKQSASQLI